MSTGGLAGESSNGKGELVSPANATGLHAPRSGPAAGKQGAAGDQFTGSPAHIRRQQLDGAQAHARRAAKI